MLPCPINKKLRKLTFATMYKEFKISSSLSVPKMADICDMGLYMTSDQIACSKLNRTPTKDATDQHEVLYEKSNHHGIEKRSKRTQFL
jgi:hypothetical protein